MKIYNVLVVMFIGIAINRIEAQCVADDCNPYLTSMGFYSECTPQGQTVSLDISWGINAASGVCNSPAGSWKIVISFPPSGIYGVVSASSVTGPKFDWEYDPTFKKLTGKTNEDIGINIYSNPPLAENGLITVVVNTNINNNCAALLSNSQVQFTPTWEPGTCLAAFQNNTTDDAMSATTGVSAPLPMKLISFTGQSRDCNHIMLNWTTSSEVNNDYMEILRSNNGKNFVSVGKVIGTNSYIGGSYSYKDDDEDLKLGKKYYYRIRQVDLDGKSTVLKTIIVNHYCGTMIPEFEIYPNPASDVINVSFSGIAKDQETELVFLNKLGVVAKKLKVKTDETTEIEVRDLPSGVYKIQTMDLDDNLSERFIRIR